jgi:N4-gp56 family major capsid protein
MAVTKLANLFDPEVVGGLIEKKLVDAMKFAPLATIDNTLEGRAGDTITLPSFNYIGDAATLAEGVALTPDLLTASTATATIHKIAKGVELTDEAVLSGYGNPRNEAINQIVLSLASQTDNEVLSTLGGIASPMVYTASSTPSDTDITAALELFGEDIDGTRVALVAPSVYTAMRANTNTWIPASEMAAGIAVRGAVGEYQGCQIMVSNKLKTSGDIYIVKPGALRIFLKRGTVVETDRDILKFSTVITASKHFVTYLYDASKAIKITS